MMSRLAALCLGAACFCPAGAQPPRSVGYAMMTGIVPTDCQAAFSRVSAAADGRILDLGLLTRRCNDGTGYRVILHTPAGLKGAVLVLRDRRVPLSDSGQTVVIDSDRDERGSDPAHIAFAAAVPPGAFPLRIETLPKGPIY